ncbi:MAG TPA: heterodisulfide reductase-related iron-sulfur binding cluster [Candidatus Lokiarchaeia archaeon]|nr:heterodisulfide reductase-related iron-sulfur binding cluster [Candidatus Lokiarchaeia archaeon]
MAAEATKNYVLFPGCTIGNRIPFLEASARAVFEKLGVTFEDAAFSCCPEPVGFQSVDKESWLALGARNLCIAEAAGKIVVSLCNGCTQTLKAVNHELQSSPESKAHVNEILAKVGKEFKGSTIVKHFVQTLIDDVGIANIKAAVVKPLTGLKVACHTGCHYSRPSEVMQWDDPMHPKYLRALVEALGAKAVDYDEEILCCGNGAAMADEDVSNKLNLRKYKSALKAGAECMAVVCPACFQQLDSKQPNINKAFGTDINLPVLYLTELMALAMGMSPTDINLKMHRVKTDPVTGKLGVKAEE